MAEKQTLHIGRFDVHLERVVLPFGLEVDSVVLRGQSLFLQHPPFEANIPEPGELEVRISSQSLAAFLEEQAPGGLHGFKVHLHGDEIVIEAVKKVVVDIKAKATCVLRIEDHRRLFVEVESVDVMGAGVKNLVQTQIDKLNPIFDTADLPVDARIERYKTHEGHLTLHGHVSPPKG